MQQNGAEKYKSSASMMPQYGDHSTDMAQLLIWTALELAGLGPNLQHLQSLPPVEAAMKKFCGVPEDYSLQAHISYGDEAKPHPDVPAKITFTEAFNKVV